MAEAKTTAKTKAAKPKAAVKKPSSTKAETGKPASKAEASATPKKAVKKAPKKVSEEFAVIETGGKQYVVSEGDTITIEKLGDGMKEGDKVTFDKVLLVDNGKDTTIGTPYIKGASVEAVLAEEGRGKKISVIRFKAKSRYFKKTGHRQPYMKVTVSAIK